MGAGIRSITMIGQWKVLPKNLYIEAACEDCTFHRAVTLEGDWQKDRQEVIEDTETHVRRSDHMVIVKEWRE